MKFFMCLHNCIGNQYKLSFHQELILPATGDPSVVAVRCFNGLNSLVLKEWECVGGGFRSACRELFGDAFDDSWRIDGEVVVNSSSACKTVYSLVALNANVTQMSRSSLLEKMISQSLHIGFPCWFSEEFYLSQWLWWLILKILQRFNYLNFHQPSVY